MLLMCMSSSYVGDRYCDYSVFMGGVENVGKLCLYGLRSAKTSSQTVAGIVIPQGKERELRNVVRWFAQLPTSLETSLQIHLNITCDMEEKVISCSDHFVLLI